MSSTHTDMLRKRPLNHNGPVGVENRIRRLQVNVEGQFEATTSIEMNFCNQTKMRFCCHRLPKGVLCSRKGVSINKRLFRSTGTRSPGLKAQQTGGRGKVFGSWSRSPRCTHRRRNCLAADSRAKLAVFFKEKRSESWESLTDRIWSLKR